LNEGSQSTPEKPDLNTLFPSPTTHQGSARLSPNEELHIPQRGFFVFDKEKGVERLWVVWSRTSVPELEALQRWANSRNLGAIGDSDQARAILALLKKHAITK